MTSLVLWGLPGGSDSKESACNAGDLGSVSGSARFPGEGNGYPFQYSCLENSTDRRAWWVIVHGVTKSRTLANAFPIPVENALLPTSQTPHIPSPLLTQDFSSVLVPINRLAISRSATPKHRGRALSLTCPVVPEQHLVHCRCSINVHPNK